MTSTPPQGNPGWLPAGSTSNTQYRTPAGRPDILIVLPEARLRDDGASARMNSDFQIGYAKKLGKPAAVVVLLGSLVSQDAAARRIYAAAMQPDNFYAAALVVPSTLSRAIGSFFLGLSKPNVPTKMFADFGPAIAWIESLQ